MDPLSIVASAGSISRLVYRLSSQLYSFVAAAKDIDETVHHLCTEVSGLAGVLNAIGASLKAHAAVSSALRENGDSDLWSSIDGSLVSCRITLEKLDGLVSGVRDGSRGHFVWVKQSIRQFKLNLRDDAIKVIRSQLHTHAVALQTALSAINV